MGEAGIAGLKAALGLSVSMISSEHFFSAGMSSPWSVAKFAKSPEDKRQVWQLWGKQPGQVSPLRSSSESSSGIC